MTDVEYAGLVAQTWDLLRGDTSNWPDRAFYRRQIRIYGEPVLDAGCGTGRLLLDYLAEGIDVDGVDVSPEMLALCRRKAEIAGLQPTLYQQAMEELELPRRYGTIIVPSSSFQLILDEDAAAEALRRLGGHLQPAGVLVMPFMALRGPGDPAEETDVTEAVREDGAIVRRTGRSVYHAETGLEDTDDLFEVIQDGLVIQSERHKRAPATRDYRRHDVYELADRAGLIVEREVRGFESPSDLIFTVFLRSKAWR